MSAACGEHSDVGGIAWRSPALRRGQRSVGITLPNVLGAPNLHRRSDEENVGAPFGGSPGRPPAFDCRALSLMTPPNFWSGGGSCSPLIVVVASGEPAHQSLLGGCRNTANGEKSCAQKNGAVDFARLKRGQALFEECILHVLFLVRFGFCVAPLQVLL